MDRYGCSEGEGGGFGDSGDVGLLERWSSWGIDKVFTLVMKRISSWIILNIRNHWKINT